MGVISRYKVLILKAVIECGFLRRILHTADLCDLLEILPNASAERESRDMWSHVMKEAKDAGLLGDILQAARRCGRHDEAVKAVDGGVRDVHEGNEKVARLGTAGVKVLSWFSFFQHLNEFDIFGALESSEIVIVYQKLVKQAKEAGVMSDVLKGANQSVEPPFWCYGGRWKLPAILTAAKKAGVLTDVLHAAITCGLLGRTVAAANEAGVLTDVLNAARTHGLLVGTVSAAKEAGVLTDVLHSASTCGMLEMIVEAEKELGVLTNLLHAASMCGLLVRNVAAAKKAGVLTDVLNAARTHGLLVRTVSAAKEAGVLTNVLHAASTCGLLGRTVAAAKEAGVLMDVLPAASTCGLLGKTVEAVKEDDVLMDVLQVAAGCGLLSHIVRETYDETVLREALRVAGMCNLVTKIVKDEVLVELFLQVEQRGLWEYLVEEAKQSRILRSILRQASRSGVIRRSWDEAKRRGVDKNYLVKSVRLLQNMKGAKTADMKMMVQTFLSGTSLDEYSMMHFPLDLICDEEDDSAPPIQKAHFLLTLAWLLLIILTLVRGHVLCRTRDAQHRKCVISHVTICSGDIERNPGPDVILNDWLKDVYSELVRRWKGWQKKNIPWKQFELPDPRNSGQDRNKLLALISRLGLLTHCANHDTSDIYAKEFQLLRDNIHDIKKLDLEVLDSIVNVRKILVKARELDDYMSLLSEDERRKAQGSVNDLQLRHVALQGGQGGQGGQVAVEDQREEEESDGEEVEDDPDEGDDRGVQISDGPPRLPQPYYPCGAAAGDEANMPSSSSLEYSNSTLVTLEQFLDQQVHVDASNIQIDESLLEESFQSVPQNEARSPKGDAHAAHTATVLSCQSSGPKEKNDSETTMEDTADVTADGQTLQTPGPTDVPSQSQKSQNFAIAPDQAPASTTSSPPVLTTDASIQSRYVLLVQNLENIFGIPDLDSRRVNENEGTWFHISRKRLHSLGSGSNCRSNKMTRFT